jgi:hypothetical protein
VNALWVLLELVSLAGLVVLVCVAVFLRSKSGLDELDGENDDPAWWPEFEREFAQYVATQEAARRTESA